MADVFLSYARGTRQIIERLASTLEHRGYRVWYDTSMLPNASLPKELRQRIREASAVIVLWSPSAVESDWVYAEALSAYTDGKRAGTQKLLCLATPDLDVHDVPLPFNGMNITPVENLNRILGGLARLGVPTAEDWAPSNPPIDQRGAEPDTGATPVPPPSPPRKRSTPPAPQRPALTSKVPPRTSARTAVHAPLSVADLNAPLAQARAELDVFEREVIRRGVVARLKRIRPLHPFLVARSVLLYGAGTAAAAVVVGPLLVQFGPRAVRTWIVALDGALAVGLPAAVVLSATAALLLALSAHLLVVVAGRTSPLLPREARQHQRLVSDVKRLEAQMAVSARLTPPPQGTV